jgi:hypothetical protein
VLLAGLPYAISLHFGKPLSYIEHPGRFQSFFILMLVHHCDVSVSRPSIQDNAVSQRTQHIAFVFFILVHSCGRLLILVSWYVYNLSGMLIERYILMIHSLENVTTCVTLFCFMYLLGTRACCPSVVVTASRLLGSVGRCTRWLPKLCSLESFSFCLIFTTPENIFALY